MLYYWMDSYKVQPYPETLGIYINIEHNL